MFTMKMEDRPLVQLENDLDRFGKKALPHAIKDTLNNAAFQSMDLARRNVGRLFEERNTWTRRSIGVNRATFNRDPDMMRSEMGSIEAYMQLQEEGFTQRKTGKHGVAIPTAAAAGQGQARRRTRRLQKKNWLSSVAPPRVRRGKGATVAAVRQAVKTGERVVHLDSRTDHYGRPSGFYRVVGRSKSGSGSGSGWPRGVRLQMIWSTEKASVRTPARKWMEYPVKKVMRGIDKIHRDAVIRQMRINQSFRDRG